MTDYQSIKERAESVIVPVVEALGYEVVEISFGCVGKTDTLTVYIYKKGGVDLDDCVRVNDALDAPLESADVTAGRAYTLNISSPGLDRPIVTDRDFERNEGEKVEAVYVKPVGKKKQVVYDFIEHVGLEWMSHVEAVACDMNSDFEEAFKKNSQKDVIKVLVKF